MSAVLWNSWHHRCMTSESVPRAVRRRAREEIVREVVEAARRQLAVEGAPGLSLRAVARELGMVSSAVYRYVASRDELLTLLIVEAYDALGAAAEDAERKVARPATGERWLAICHAVRDWARAHPHEYALLYGSPVPGYQAPQATIGPATRVTALLSDVLRDAVVADPASGDPASGDPASDGPASGGPGPDGARPLWAAAMRPARPFVPEEVPDELLVRGLMAWTYLFGAVSFELFGHRHGVLSSDPDLLRAFFTEESCRIGRLAGLPL